MAARIDARETARLLGRAPTQAGEATAQLQRELRAAVRKYERAALKLRRLRAQVRKAQVEVKVARREMRLWFSAVEAPPYTSTKGETK